MNMTDRVTARLEEMKADDHERGDMHTFTKDALEHAARLADLFADVTPRPYVVPANSMFVAPTSRKSA